VGHGDVEALAGGAHRALETPGHDDAVTRVEEVLRRGPRALDVIAELLEEGARPIVAVPGTAPRQHVGEAQLDVVCETLDERVVVAAVERVVEAAQTCQLLLADASTLRKIRRVTRPRLAAPDERQLSCRPAWRRTPRS
jgi:hypothetical protein